MKTLRQYDENSDKGYFLEVDINYQKNLFNLHKDLLLLPERKKVEKAEKLICSIEEKEKYSHMSFKTRTKSQFKAKKGT